MSTKILHTFTACLLTFAISFSAVSNAMQDNQRLPEIGTTGAAFMSIERERVVGDFYMRQVRSQAPIVHDPVLDSYLNSIGQRLVRNTSGVRYPFNFFGLTIRK